MQRYILQQDNVTKDIIGITVVSMVTHIHGYTCPWLHIYVHVYTVHVRGSLNYMYVVFLQILY